jgi:hypothetical protein
VYFCFQPYYTFTLLLYLALLFYSWTCWVPTISVLNLDIFPCYSNLLLRRWIWRILRWWVLGLCCLGCFHVDYGAFRCSAFVRVVLIFEDIIYVILILYSWHLAICEHFLSVVWNKWSWEHMRWVFGFVCKIGSDIFPKWWTKFIKILK